MSFLKLITIIGIGLSGLVVYNLAWARCDCTQYPFKPDPPCFNECCVKFLLTASTKELNNMLGLDQETIQKISVVNSAVQQPQSLEDYRKVLSPAEFKHLVERLRSIDQIQFKHFIAEKPKRFKGYFK